MILYGSSLSPYVRKVLAFAAEKGVELDVRSVVPGSQDPGFRAASPFGKMPALEDGDFRISDSSAIVAYLEALRPEPRLIPTEPRALARTIWFDEFADTILFATGRDMFFNRIVAPLTGREGDAAVAERAQARDLPPLLDYVESQLTDSGYLVEDRLTLADLAVAGTFVNFDHCDVDLSGRPRLKGYVDAILARPSFAGWVAREKAFLARWREGRTAGDAA